MGSAPQTVNYRGDVLTDEMKNLLFGEKGFVPDELHRKGSKLSPDRVQEMLSNWMFGIKPKPIDPSEAFTRESSLSGVRQRGAAGAGMGGLFGFGKYSTDTGAKLEPIQPLDAGPMAPGVPYSVPPLPKLRPMASGGG